MSVSYLRHVLDPVLAEGSGSTIRRQGDAYLLDLPAGHDVDVATFDRLREEGRAARARGDERAFAEAYEAALASYAGDLFPEEGPAEWVVDERESRRSHACEIAQDLAEASLRQGDAARAARAAERGLEIDRYRDELWRACVAAHERLGDRAEAERLRRAYDDVLRELGVTAPSS